MNKTVLFLVAIALFSFCASGHVDSLNNIVDQLVQLNTDAGRPSGQIDLLVSRVSDGIKSNFASFDRHFAALKTRCDGGAEILKNYIKKLTGDRTLIQTKLNAAEKSNAGIAAEIASHGKNLKKAHEELVDLEKRVEQEIDNYRIFASETESKLDTVKVLRDIINDELVGKKSGRSFVQLSTFSTKLHELKGLLENSSDSRYTPILSTLIALAEERGFSDQTVLNKILDVLKKLDANLTAFRKKQEIDHRNNLKNLRALARDKVKQIRTISDIIAQRKSAKIDNDSIIRDSKRDLEYLKRNIARKEREFSQFDKICRYESKIRVEGAKFRDEAQAGVKTVSSALLNFK